MAVSFASRIVTLPPSVVRMTLTPSTVALEILAIILAEPETVSSPVPVIMTLSEPLIMLTKSLPAPVLIVVFELSLKMESLPSPALMVVSLP